MFCVALYDYWTHLEKYLGSDHALLATTLDGLKYKARIGTAHLTDWAKMRETRSQRPGNEDRQYHLSIQDWITQLHQDVLVELGNVHHHPVHRRSPPPHVGGRTQPPEVVEAPTMES
ncbi:hypothetical protein IscW_ISCW001822 [Ixodes scapularis]|uniref:Uncharacterized protein n=1 Tax=Ixodes scapularis TaxID=6945 RepID=B7P1U4_IXOSC|nr:hypothetical protein IscW_ISCW001822 [Ixodes scapularis]|eukprot:XP_002433502.1 hypothetical protein IscW_ISCW001822 [Ixodes scapularis]